MKYKADLSIYPTLIKDGQPFAKCVGFLDRNHDYKIGEVSDSFLERLKIFCFHPIAGTISYGPSAFWDGKSEEGITVEHNGIVKQLGSGLILVVGKQDTFIAPDLIYYYITRHQYNPPAQFIKAVSESPIPTSRAHQLFVQSLEWQATNNSPETIHRQTLERLNWFQRIVFKLFFKRKHYK